MRTIAFLSLLGVVAAMPALAQDFDAIEFRTTDLGAGIYMLQGAGGNLGLSVGEDGVFLIDDDYAPLAEKIRGAIAAVTDQPVGFLINTHCTVTMPVAMSSLAGPAPLSSPTTTCEFACRPARAEGLSGSSRRRQTLHYRS